VFKNKNIFIAGGNGFIGSNLIKRLSSMGANIKSTKHNNSPKITGKNIEYVKVDLTDAKQYPGLLDGMDYVFMCAANTSGASVMEKTPLVHVTPNIIMNTLMLKAAYAANVKKFMFVSSNTVYPVSESHVKEEEAVYGSFFHKYFCVAWMKRFSEVLCEMYSTKITNPMVTIIVRPANAFGEYDDFNWETSHVIPALIRKVVERQNPIEVWGDGNDLKDFIYIEDLIDGMILAMDKIETFDCINIGSGNGYTIKDILNDIVELDGYSNPDIIFDSSKPTMIPKRLIDVSKAKDILDWEYKVCIKEGLRKTIKWYKENRLK